MSSSGCCWRCLVGKMVATSLTIAIGGSGGVFAPSLFMGAMLGSLAGSGAHALFGAAAAPAGAYGLVGMGAVFAAAARAPITAVIIIFELTGDYTIILPLMTAVVIAAAVSNLLSRDTIYTLKLRRRGIDVTRGRGANLMGIITVAEAMKPLPDPVSMDADLAELTTRLLDERRDALPVIGPLGEYRGVVTSRQVEEAMASNSLDVTAESLMSTVVPVNATASLHDALAELVQHSRGGIPVLDDGELVGWLTHGDVLSAYHRRLQQSMGSAIEQRPPPRTTVPRPAPRLGDFRIVEVTLGEHSPGGRRVMDVPWPESSLVVAVRRGDQVIVPRGDTELLPHDRLTVLLPSSAASDLADLVSAAPSPTAARDV